MLYEVITHGHAARRVHVDQQVHGQEVDDGIGHGDAADGDADEVAQARQNHGGAGGQGAGVDDRGHGVGRVVEAVDELEAQGDAEGDDELV